jgi:hypothetical protein
MKSTVAETFVSVDTNTVGKFQLEIISLTDEIHSGWTFVSVDTNTVGILKDVAAIENNYIAILAACRG